MSERKYSEQKNGFSFTINNLINSRNDEASDDNQLLHPCKAVMLQSLPTGYPGPPNDASMSKFLKWRGNEEDTEYNVIADKNLMLVSGINRNQIGERTQDTRLRCETALNQEPYSTLNIDVSDCSVTIPSPESSPDSNSSRYKKKSRTAFTNEQLDQLEKRFYSQRYLAPNERSNVAEELKLTDQQVKTWFQNRRMKEKRQQKVDQMHTIPFPTGGVEVAQLRALGIPCPLPPGHMKAPSYLPWMNYRPSAQIVSQITPTYLPTAGHSNNLTFFPHQGYQYYFNPFPV